MGNRTASDGVSTLFRTVPGLQAIASYKRQWLAKDIVAGVVLTTLLVPQGMAYAELAGLPLITGLYTSILCLLGYAVFGPSRILVLGPDSSLGPMIAATVLPLVAAGGDPARAVALASMLAIMVGAIMVLAAVAKLGFIADLLSKPTMIGYMNGLAKLGPTKSERSSQVFMRRVRPVGRVDRGPSGRRLRQCAGGRASVGRGR
jgi:MFS superfamily sulfate permease-like transporter